jgi:hypothetical protein
LLPRRWLIAATLALCACSAPSSKEVQKEWPAIRPGSGRIVFLGDNYGWYGVLEGGSWEPAIALDGRVLDIDNGEGVYFAVDSAVGKRVLSVDGQEQLSIVVQEKSTKYVGMERYAQVNDDFGLRKANYKMRLVQLSESTAQMRLKGLEFLGFAQ